MKYEIGIDTSLDEKDMVNYLEEVIKETKTKQRSNWFHFAKWTI